MEQNKENKENKEKNFVSAVIYCCNDGDRIGEFLNNLDGILQANFLKYEIIVVNDASDDDSPRIIKDYAHAVNCDNSEHIITLLNMSYRQGLEASMNAGLNLTIGDFVFEFDSVNDDYEWVMLMKVYRHLLTGYDIVSASNKNRSSFISSMYYRLFNRYAHIQYAIVPESFRILSRRAINRVHSISQTIPYRKAAYANCGLTIDSLAYEPCKMLTKKFYDDRRIVAIESLLLYTDLPFRATMILSLFMFLISVIVGIYAVIYRLLMNPVEGWTTTIFFLSFGFSGLFIILAVVIRYIQTLVRLNFRKKDYLFESIEKLQ